jgi:ssDNA-binding Zn-finger/Zn-ribbon topoisomerase 1
MQKLEMIPCPKCGNDFPLKRKELGFHVCVNCSSTKPVVAITTVEGSGDHTWNDIIIMDQDKAAAIARKEAEVMGHKVDIEMLDFDGDDMAISQSVKERVQQVLDDQEDDEEDLVDPDKKLSAIEGIDY